MPISFDSVQRPPSSIVETQVSTVGCGTIHIKTVWSNHYRLTIIEPHRDPISVHLTDRSLAGLIAGAAQLLYGNLSDD